MKKTLVVFMLMASIGFVASKVYAEDTCKQTPNSNSNSSSVVDLSQSKTLTPTLLRTSDDNDNPYIPKQYQSLKTTPPPKPQ